MMTQILYKRFGIYRQTRYESYDLASVKARCPHCKCAVIEEGKRGDDSSILYDYVCSNFGYGCEFKTTGHPKTLGFLADRVKQTLNAEQFKDAEIINLDGVLTPVITKSKERAEDEDGYWAEVKITKDPKGKTLLMVLAGHKEEQTKAQLFFVPADKRVGFDQNDTHPSEVFVMIEGTFKDSKSNIIRRDDE